MHFTQKTYNNAPNALLSTPSWPATMNTAANAFITNIKKKTHNSISSITISSCLLLIRLFHFFHNFFFFVTLLLTWIPRLVTPRIIRCRRKFNTFGIKYLSGLTIYTNMFHNWQLLNAKLNVFQQYKLKTFILNTDKKFLSLNTSRRDCWSSQYEISQNWLTYPKICISCLLTDIFQTNFLTLYHSIGYLNIPYLKLTYIYVYLPIHKSFIFQAQQHWNKLQ